MNMRKTLIAIALGASLATGGALAQATPEAKAAVDAAKLAGSIGEQGDGYLGLVGNKADPALIASMQRINAGRAAAYRATAAKTGVTAEAAGQATAQVLYGRLPAGAWYRPAGGGWTQK